MGAQFPLGGRNDLAIAALKYLTFVSRIVVTFRQPGENGPAAFWGKFLSRIPARETCR